MRAVCTVKVTVSFSSPYVRDARSQEPKKVPLLFFFLISILARRKLSPLELSLIVYRLYHINTDKFTHILLNHDFINTIRYCNTFRLLKCHLQGV